VTELFQRITEALGTDNGAEIGRMVKLSKQNVYRWRDGEGVPTTETLLNIYKLSGISLHWVLTGEGEKYPSNVVTNVTKSLVRDEENLDTPPAQNKQTTKLTRLASSPIHTREIPVTAVLSTSKQQLVSKEGQSVSIPKALVDEDSELIQVEGDDLESEGLRNGDMLIVRPANGHNDGKLVVAELNGQIIVRKIEERGDWLLLSSPEGDGEIYRVPASKVAIKYEVTSVIHNFNQ